MYHVAEQGDCISGIAANYGFFPDTIWNHPENADLKSARKDPNILLPGDSVFIPDKKEKTESVATEKLHKFKRKGVPEYLSLCFMANGVPRKGEKYTLNIDGKLSSGKLDGKGCCSAPIPPGAQGGTITVGDPEAGDVYKLDLGHMDPIDTDSGVAGRLRNLGYACSENPDADELANAVRDFQADEKLSQKNGLDDATRERLKKVHGS